MIEAAAAKPVVRAPLSPTTGLPSPPTRRSDALLPARRMAARLGQEWLPGAIWAAGRTGRAGLIGMALIIASATFFFSTQLQVANQVSELRSQLAASTNRSATTARTVADDPVRALRSLPARAEMPALLGVLLKQAEAAQLTIDTGKYEMTSTKTGNVVRYKVSFPVSGPYSQVRKFIDGTLTAMPAVAISDLSFERKTIGDAAVEAQIRLTVFTRGTP